MNNRLGKNFSRYLREHRIQDEPAASVLCVGLSVGFSSQSNFYEAFREIEGTTPGQYRKVMLKRLEVPGGFYHVTLFKIFHLYLHNA
ncbi:MAG: AraC family transcriptional regulator [Gammaproteobacteria bacterium]|nr:AraC family transcriptional regulator [Gammaproteobacteria bacterium]